MGFYEIFVYSACLMVLASAVPMSTTHTATSFCPEGASIASKEILLGANNPAQTVSLAPETFAAVCRLRIAAPASHLVHLKFMESSAHLRRSLVHFNSTESHPPCTMSIYLPDDSTRPFWEGDPCSMDPLPDVDLLTSDFEVVWPPPPNPHHTRGRTFVVTAIGKGSSCKEAGQHTCLRIGRQPVLCVPESLVCDGVPNCPTSSTNSDESEQICRGGAGRGANSWEQLAQEFAVKILTKFHGPQNGNQMEADDEKERRKSSKNIMVARKNIEGRWENWKKVNIRPSTTPKPIRNFQEQEQAIEAGSGSFNELLSKYGPWGYLLIGLLICGSVLMLCGLWECCFRKTKDPRDAVPPQASSESGEVVIRQSLPPHYDEIEEPPSYTTLFPRKTTSDTSSLDESFYSTCNGTCERGAGQSAATTTTVVTIAENHI